MSRIANYSTRPITINDRNAPSPVEPTAQQTTNSFPHFNAASLSII